MSDRKKELMKGNEAFGEGAVKAGCRYYFGYPITPQSELAAYLSWRMFEVGGFFLQAESEIAAINMVLGAAATGVRTMTSSSSPGISLKQEGISYMVGSELPAVIVNVQRGGPGLGNIAPSQADYFQATRGGGHGDYYTIVLAPFSCQEMFDLAILAFELADKYRNPVMVLSDGSIGQMMEPVVIPEKVESKQFDKPWALTGCKGRKPNIINSLYLDENILEKQNIMLQKKYTEIRNNEVRFQTMNMEDADVAVVAFGSCARICMEAMAEARKMGIKVGMIRPITLWPFPEQVIRAAAGKVKHIAVVEQNAGQMIEDVRLAVEGRCPVKFHGRMGGVIPQIKDILEIFK